MIPALQRWWTRHRPTPVTSRQRYQPPKPVYENTGIGVRKLSESVYENSRNPQFTAPHSPGTCRRNRVGRCDPGVHGIAHCRGVVAELERVPGCPEELSSLVEVSLSFDRPGSTRVTS